MGQAHKVVALALGSLIALALVGAAAADAEVTAELGPSPDSYYSIGSGFTPGDLVNIVEVACPELPCPSDGLAAVRDVSVAPDGAFRVLLQTHTGVVPGEGQDYRVIVIQEPGVPLASEGSPFVQVPLHHDGVGPPTVGSGFDVAPHSGVPVRPGPVTVIVLAVALLGGGWLVARGSPSPLAHMS